MIETTVKVGGMMCGMCEAHVSDAIRGALPVKKVTASHTKGQAVILSEAPLTRRPCGPPSARPAMRCRASAPGPMRKRDCSAS